MRRMPHAHVNDCSFSFKGNVRRQARASGMGRARDAVVVVGIAHIVRRVLCAQERRRLVGAFLDRVERAPAGGPF